MKVAITGSEGKVAQALIAALDPKQCDITRFALPEHDATNLADLNKATRGHDALIHLAWKDLNVDDVDPANRVMYENAYAAAIANKIGLVIMGSSNHARDHNVRETDGRIRYTGGPETANNPYGEEKQRMERRGNQLAKEHGLRVICLRIGNVNPEDRPKPDKPTRWMSHRDLGQLVSKALRADLEPGHFEVVYGVSRQSVFDWINSFGYEPVDSAE
ncbi:NAD(P)-dependent oxidoreductase [soil metagenome]